MFLCKKSRKIVVLNHIKIFILDNSYYLNLLNKVFHNIDVNKRISIL